MSNFNNVTLLDIIEEYADCNNLVASEEQLSELFDETIAPSIIETYGPDDEPAIYEAFNNFTDSLCTDGELHPEQYSQYEYVGEYS